MNPINGELCYIVRGRPSWRVRAPRPPSPMWSMYPNFARNGHRDTEFEDTNDEDPYPTHYQLRQISRTHEEYQYRVIMNGQKLEEEMLNRQTIDHSESHKPATDEYKLFDDPVMPQTLAEFYKENPPPRPIGYEKFCNHPESIEITKERNRQARLTARPASPGGFDYNTWNPVDFCTKEPSSMPNGIGQEDEVLSEQCKTTENDEIQAEKPMEALGNSNSPSFIVSTLLVSKKSSYADDIKNLDAKEQEGLDINALKNEEVEDELKKDPEAGKLNQASGFAKSPDVDEKDRLDLKTLENGEGKDELENGKLNEASGYSNSPSFKVSILEPKHTDDIKNLDAKEQEGLNIKALKNEEVEDELIIDPEVGKLNQASGFAKSLDVDENGEGKNQLENGKLNEASGYSNSPSFKVSILKPKHTDDIKNMDGKEQEESDLKTLENSDEKDELKDDSEDEKQSEAAGYANGIDEDGYESDWSGMYDKYARNATPKRINTGPKNTLENKKEKDYYSEDSSTSEDSYHLDSTTEDESEDKTEEEEEEEESEEQGVLDESTDESSDERENDPPNTEEEDEQEQQEATDYNNNMVVMNND